MSIFDSNNKLRKQSRLCSSTLCKRWKAIACLLPVNCAPTFPTVSVRTPYTETAILCHELSLSLYLSSLLSSLSLSQYREVVAGHGLAAFRAR